MPISGPIPLTIQFTNSSSSQFISFLWSFGDGTTSTAASPLKTYSVAGTYIASLTATSTDGSVTFTDTVVAGGATAVWTQPDPAYEGCPGTDPQVMLRTSNDGGRTYVSERWRSAGKTGEYTRRVRWTRCGSARRRVYEVIVSDPIPWRITGAYLRAEGIQPPGGRR